MKSKPSKLDAYAERLDTWFGIDKKSLAEVQEQLRLDGCAVSLSRLSDWWATRLKEKMQAALLGQITSGARQIQEVEKALGKSGAPELETLMKLHRVLIFKMSSQGNADSEMLELVGSMMKAVMQYERLKQYEKQNKLDERRVELLEKRAELAFQAQEVTESKLTAEEKQQRMREIFGIS